MVPILIEEESHAGGEHIDSHVILTVYDRKDWLDKLVKPAVDIENRGKIGVFYLNEKARSYSAFRQLKGDLTSDFLHNINDNGSPVKDKYKVFSMVFF